MESPILQELLGKEWDILSPESQALQRSRQAKLGYKCSDCGRVGFIRRTCPSCPPVCYDRQAHKLCPIKDKGYMPDINEQQSVYTMKRLPDNSSGIDELLTHSAFHGWYPRWAAQTGKPSKVLNTGDRTTVDQRQRLGNLGKVETKVSDNLYITLCCLVEGLKNALMEIGVPFQEDRLPLNPLGHERVPWREKGYPPSKWIKQEYSRYFAGERKKELYIPQRPKRYQYLGGLRVEDDQRYLFDRASLPNNSSVLRRHLNLDYIPRPKGYRGRTAYEMGAQKHIMTDVEQKRAEEWCTTTTTPSKDKKNRPRNVNIESKCAVEQQGALLQQQEVLLQQQGRNAQHLLEVLHKEIMAEHRREHDLLTCSQKELNMKSSAVLQERVESADRIIDTLMEYGLFPRMEELEERVESADRIIDTLMEYGLFNRMEELEHILYSLKRISSCMEMVTMKESSPISARRNEQHSNSNSSYQTQGFHRSGVKGRIGNRNKAGIGVQTSSVSSYATQPLRWK